MDSELLSPTQTKAWMLTLCLILPGLEGWTRILSDEHQLGMQLADLLLLERCRYFCIIVLVHFPCLVLGMHIEVPSSKLYLLSDMKCFDIKMMSYVLEYVSMLVNQVPRNPKYFYNTSFKCNLNKVYMANLRSGQALVESFIFGFMIAGVLHFGIGELHVCIGFCRSSTDS